MKQNKETLKEYFETGDKPTQQQYADLIDSYVDSKQPEGEANRRFVIDEMGEVSVASEKIAPVYTLSDIVANKLSLLKDGEVVKEIDLSSYIDDTNLARLVSGTVDENGLATFTRDDNSTFTLDFSSLKGGVTFADEEGNVKYSSSIDKRTGYYDVDNKIYYPNISYVSGGRFNWFNISHDEKLRVVETGRYAGANFEWASGIAFDVSNHSIKKVRLSVELNIFSRGNQHFNKILISGTMNLSLGVFTWDNQKASIIGGEISSDKLVNVFFGKVEGKPFIGASVREGLNSHSSADLTFSNMSVDIKTDRSIYKISEFYNGIEKKSSVNNYPGTETSHPSTFLEIDTKIDYNDMLPAGKIVVENAGMDKSFDKNLVYDSVNKKYGFVSRVEGIASITEGVNISIDSTDPYNPIISANTDGGIILKTPDGTKDYRISIDNSGNIITTQVV